MSIYVLAYLEQMVFLLDVNNFNNAYQITDWTIIVDLL